MQFSAILITTLLSSTTYATADENNLLRGILPHLIVNNEVKKSNHHHDIRKFEGLWHGIDQGDGSDQQLSITCEDGQYIFGMRVCVKVKRSYIKLTLLSFVIYLYQTTKTQKSDMIRIIMHGII